MKHSVRVTVESVAGRCSAGMKPGDSYLIRDRGCMKIEEAEGFCPELFFVTFPTCMAFAAGGELRWEVNGAATVACPDPEARVVVRIEREP